MQRCIQLAKLGRGFTQSNPLVGAVLLYNNRIIGEGYHQKFGEAHAEINCLASVQKKDEHLVPKSTLYVNLEPCNHTGKTPPCSHAIVKARIKKVVVGTTDINPLVASQGIAYLQNNGVEVICGIEESACNKLNKVFFTNHKYKRAFIKLKWAETADGYIGETEKNLAISNAYTNIISHKNRAVIDGIMVGYNTAKNDSPSLTSRHWQGKQPARIFLDWNCELEEVLFKEPKSQTIVLNSKTDAATQNIQYKKVEKSSNAIAKALYELGINSVLVEGGAATHNLFIKHKLWDEAIIIKNDATTGKGINAAALNSGNLMDVSRSFSDTIYHYSNSEFIK